MDNFHVGQKVVCVDAMRHPEWASNRGVNHSGHWPLSEGAVYTVRWAGHYTMRENLATVYGVRLEGVDRETRGTLDTPFLATRFRPVAEKPTAMEMIRTIVAGGPITETGEPRLPSPVPEYVQGDRL